MFNRLVKGYDRFNFFSSLGLDRRWRKMLVNVIPEGSVVLDVGTGTGDLALAASKKAKQVVGIDFSLAMIQKAKEKGQPLPSVQFQVGEAHSLPFRAGQFDVVTSGFVLRNLYRMGSLENFYRESFRVLKTGGISLSLELTRPLNSVLQWGHQVYLKTVLPLIGKTLFGNRWPSQYLAGSIHEFPEPARIEDLLSKTGFRSIEFSPLHGGIAGLFFALR